MTADIKKIEDLSLNAWPSHQMQVYDGWILRFSYFYTHRTNCVEQIGPSSLPLKEKVSYCEEVYRYWDTPCIFKISPVGDPELDELLMRRGYRIEHSTTVMTRPLGGTEPHSLRKGLTLQCDPRVDQEWIDGLFWLKGGASPIHRQVVPQMYAAIPKEELAVTVKDGRQIVGTGLGILDRDAIGIYAIHTAPSHRRQGIARAVVSAILAGGEARGATCAYLQVVSDNAPAKSLYRELGFTDSYRYYFRTLHLKEELA